MGSEQANTMQDDDEKEIERKAAVKNFKRRMDKDRQERREEYLPVQNYYLWRFFFLILIGVLILVIIETIKVVGLPSDDMNKMELFFLIPIILVLLPAIILVGIKWNG